MEFDHKLNHRVEKDFVGEETCGRSVANNAPQDPVQNEEYTGPQSKRLREYIEWWISEKQKGEAERSLLVNQISFR